MNSGVVQEMVDERCYVTVLCYRRTVLCYSVMLQCYVTDERCYVTVMVRRRADSV